ncbi:hypothetical protein DFS34DRAFT_157017 [Phlyctochytrium arcticum]|nr:hypothetical protein DFS34DRAFT_157017 [Phlyctochytrium arcticum]
MSEVVCPPSRMSLNQWSIRRVVRIIAEDFALRLRACTTHCPHWLRSWEATAGMVGVGGGIPRKPAESVLAQIRQKLGDPRVRYTLRARVRDNSAHPIARASVPASRSRGLGSGQRRPCVPSLPWTAPKGLPHQSRQSGKCSLESGPKKSELENQPAIITGDGHHQLLTGINLHHPQLEKPPATLFSYTRVLRKVFLKCPDGVVAVMGCACIFSRYWGSEMATFTGFT